MDDQTLLAQYIATRDANAFAELTRRYAGLVKGVCIRVLGNSHDAEEVAQECFLELARDAERVHSSVGGWLHRAATTRSLNVLRSRIRRKVREREVGYDPDTAAASNDIGARELHKVIDGALTELPDDLRVPVILHYFDGRSQRDVALELGVNQSTISRRMQDALRHLRETLSRAGYVATTPAMMILMQDQAVTAATESGLVKVAVTGTASKAAGGATLGSCVKGITTASLPFLSFLIFGGWVSLLVAIGLTLYVGRYQPKWVAELFSSLGAPDVYHEPTYCLGRWNWTTPPKDWCLQLRASAAWSVIFLGLTLAFAIGTNQTPWGTVVLGLLVAIGFLAHALRIVHRMSIVRNGNATESNIVQPRNSSTTFSIWERLAGLPSNDPTMTWIDATQLVFIGFGGVAIALTLLIHPAPSRLWPSAMLCGLIGAGMLYSGLWLSRQLARRSTSNSPAADHSSERESHSSGTRAVLATGATIVVALSCWTAWNPGSVRGLSLSLAALQTSMLGWMVYRMTARCQGVGLNIVRSAILFMLASCFVLNSGVCLANWLR